MNKAFFSATLFLFGLSMAVLSCKKQVATEIEGSWMREAFTNSYKDSAIWHFNNGTLVIDNINHNAYDDTGRYVVVEKNLSVYVRIDGLVNQTGENVENGDWRVIQYKKDMLTLTKSDEDSHGNAVGNILREFTRIN